jgi:hypothetical protein
MSFDMKKNILLSLAVILFFFNLSAQTNRVTVSTGSWNTSSIWSPSGVPGSSNNVTVNHDLLLNRSITVSGAYTFNADVTNALPTKYNLTISSTGVLTVYKKLYVAGRVVVNSGGRIILKNGAQLITDSLMSIASGATIDLEDNSTLTVKNYLSNAGTINNAGVISITQNYFGNIGIVNKVNNGKLTSLLSMRSTTGSIYGTTNAFCSSNCDADNFLCSGIVAEPIVSDMSRCGSGSFIISPTGGTGLYRFYLLSTGGVALNISPSTKYTTPILTNTTDYYVASINANGCESARVKVTLTIRALPNPVVVTDTFRCRTGSVSLFATGSDSTYRWFNSSGSLVFTGSVFNTPSLSVSTFYRVGAVNRNKCVTPTNLRDTATVTIKSSCDLVWSGTQSDQWNNALNWDGGQIPSSTDNVIVPSGTLNNLKINSSVNVANFSIGSGAIVNSEVNGILNLFGNMNVIGSYNNLGDIQIKGSSPQTITGSFPIVTLNLQSTSSATLLNPYTITKRLTLTSGELISNGNLTIDLNTANVDGSGVGLLTGNVTVSKSVGSSKTHYFTCPLDGVTCQDLIDDAEVINPSSNKSRLFELTPANTWVVVSDMNAPLTKGKAYSLFFTAPTTLDFTGTYDHAFVQTLSIDNSVAKDYFIPNPYPCSLDWDAQSGWINKDVFLNSISFWDGANSRYATYTNGVGTNGATNIIPSLQGYWLKSTGTGGTIAVVIGKGALVSNQTFALWKTIDTQKGYKIILTNVKDGSSDETIVCLDPNSNDGTFATKLLNGGTCPNVSISLNNENFAINTIDKEKITVLPLSVQVNEPGMYNISVKSIGNANLSDVKIKDLQNSIIYSDSTFDINVSSIQSMQRVAIIFNSNNSLNNSEINVFANNKDLSIVNNSSETINGYKIVDALGNVVFETTREIESGQVNLQNVNQLKFGVYNVICVKSNHSESFKVLVTE